MNSTQVNRNSRYYISDVLSVMVQHPDFKDAIDGIKLLYSWDFDAMIELPSFDIEVRRALDTANLCAELYGVQRSHENWASTSLTDGDVIRYLMNAADVVGDWAFLPAMRVAQSH